MMKPLYDPEEKNINDIPEPEPFRWTDLEVERVEPAFYAAEDEEEILEEQPKETEKKKSLEAVLEERIKQVEEHLEKTRRESEIIHENARRKGYEEGKKTGYSVGLKEGFEEGKNDGYAEYAKKIDELEESFAAFMKEAEKAKQKMLDDYLQDLKEIALVIGEKIVRTSLRTNSNVVERMILASTEKLKKSAWAKIYIADAQEGKSIQADAKFLKELSYLSDHIKIVVMDGMEPGTCIIERPDEIIDISVGTQLENIREIMNNAKL